MSYSFLEAKAKLEALCAYQERCQYEMNQKLISWDFLEEQRNQLIADLISNNFINEERFASAFVSGKFRIKKWGKNKIKSHLRMKQISDYSIERGMNEIDPDEYWKTILELIEKKAKDLSTKKGDHWVKRAKIYTFLLSRGFESDLVSDAIKESNI